ncbi:hypothetical protein C8F01DRAFT_1094245 [Mycena amicta]|nr:hypothetical protein C8F01DRAFT_1094245 [Mycena amicta]
MSVLPPQWPSTPLPPWYGFSALAAAVPSPFNPNPSPSHHQLAMASFPAFGHGHPVAQPQPQPSSSSFGGIPAKNTRPLDRDALLRVLDFFSTCIAVQFGTSPSRPIRLVIHGGAVMLLNAELSQLAAATDAHSRQRQRSTTRDIDYILRSFVSEWACYGVHDAAYRLRQCILETARQFGLGADWMNSDADVALPMATDPVTGTLYDPIHAASVQVSDSLTVYASPNGLLHLVSVTPYWTVALKMVRFNAADREDICILLRSGIRARNIHWTPARLELWLLGQAWAMGYTGYDAQRIATMRKRMVEVVAEVNRWDPEAVMDDGRGGVVPLRSPPPSYQQQPQQMYGHGHGHEHDLASHPIYSPQSFTTISPPPFIPPQQPIAVEASPKTKKHKKKHKDTETTSWSNSPYGAYPYTYAASPIYAGPGWEDPEPERSPDRWAADVRRAAEKEQRNGRMASWLPFRRRSKDEEGLQDWENVSSGSDTDSDTDTDTDTDDEGWLEAEAERRRWGTYASAQSQSQSRSHKKTKRRRRTHTPARVHVSTAASDVSYVRVDAGSTPGPPPPHGLPGLQYSIASFMSGGMDMDGERVGGGERDGERERREREEMPVPRERHLGPASSAPALSQSQSSVPWVNPYTSQQQPPASSAPVSSPPAWYTASLQSLQLPATSQTHPPPSQSHPHPHPQQHPHQQQQQQAHRRPISHSQSLSQLRTVPPPPMQPQPPVSWGTASWATTTNTTTPAHTNVAVRAHTIPGGLPSPPRVHPNHPWTHWNRVQVQSMQQQQQQAQASSTQQRALSPILNLQSGINGPPLGMGTEMTRRMGSLGLY